MSDINHKIVAESLEQIIKAQTERIKVMKGDIGFLIEYAEKYIRRYTKEPIKERLQEIKQKLNSRFYEK